MRGRLDKLPFEMRVRFVPTFPGLLLGVISLINLGLSNDRGMM
jgi:hypothetical protein